MPDLNLCAHPPKVVDFYDRTVFEELSDKLYISFVNYINTKPSSEKIENHLPNGLGSWAKCAVGSFINTLIEDDVVFIHWNTFDFWGFPKELSKRLMDPSGFKTYGELQEYIKSIVKKQ